MSRYIQINRWSGNDPQLATRTMAKVFKMDTEKVSPVLEQLSAGRPWRFERTIPDHQGQKAVMFLRTLGFEAELTAEFDEAGAFGEAREPGLAERAPSPPATGGSIPFGFHGTGGELFMILLKNIFFNIFTLGIYNFWGKTRVRKFLLANASFGSDRFSYHGTGKELYKGQVKFVGYIILAMLLLVAQQMFLAPETFKIVEGVLPLLFVMLIPPFMVGSWRYRLSRTSLRGIRFSFRGERKQALGLYAKWMFFLVISLGFYYPWFKINSEKFWRGNSHYGNKPFEFNGRGGDLLGPYLLLVLLLIPTLGIYWSWYRAKLQHYIWGNTRILGGTFRFTATGWDVFKLHFVNFLLITISSGLAYPWIVVRNKKFLTGHLFLEGAPQLDQVVQEMKDSGALGDEALNDMDMPVEMF